MGAVYRAAVSANYLSTVHAVTGPGKGFSIRPSGVARRLADYTDILNLITKVLDFVQLGGPNLTVGSTIFEMWMGL